MFDLKRPCINCPFRKGQGQLFGLRAGRLAEIREGPAFQCHRTLRHLHDGEHWQGDRPQQCAGLMTVLARDGADNQIMQVAQRLGHLDVAGLDPDCEAYDSWADVLAAHSESA
jgi:hypothetical protein